MKFNKSIELHKRTKEIIPVCSQVFSKGYKYFPLNVAPQYIDHAKGCYVWDMDGNKYLDYIMGLCAVTLGYNYTPVDKAIKNQLKKGISFSLCNKLETELAEILRSIIPCAEMSRFFKTGSEATSAAIRLARAYTNRDHIAYCGYHGWHDWIAGSTDRKFGVPESTIKLIHKFTYNDIHSLENILNFESCAAIIMEPIVSKMPQGLFLHHVRNLADKHKCILIFDEIVTGFRIGLSGAQGYFGVTPDLATFGKGMANGMPMGCVVGHKTIMNEFNNVMVSSTFGGELLSIAASIATINEMRKKDVFGHISSIGKQLMSDIRNLGVEVNGYPGRFVYELPDNSPETRTLFMQYMIEKGILIHPTLAINLCYSHSNWDIGKASLSFKESLEELKYAISKKEVKSSLKGNAIEMAFRRLD